MSCAWHMHICEWIAFGVIFWWCLGGCVLKARTANLRVPLPSHRLHVWQRCSNFQFCYSQKLYQHYTPQWLYATERRHFEKSCFPFQLPSDKHHMKHYSELVKCAVLPSSFYVIEICAQEALCNTQGFLGVVQKYECRHYFDVYLSSSSSQG